MDKQELWGALERAGVVQYNGHVVLRSGLHTSTYANLVPIRVPYLLREELISHLEEAFPHQPDTTIDDLVIVGAGCGGWYASVLAYRMQTEYAYAVELSSGHYVFRRDQASGLQGKHVVLIDDVLCTGESSVRIIEQCMRSGAIIDGALFILDRKPSPTVHLLFEAHLTLPPRVVFHVPMQTWTRATCPMCAQGMPFSTEHGAGAEEFHRLGQPQKS